MTENRVRACAWMLWSVAGATAWGQVSPPPSIGRNGEKIIYVAVPGMNYAVSDFGWSDTWMTPDLPVVTPLRDFLSGDDAGNLHYRINGVQKGGNGWLTPTLDGGALTPSIDTLSPWVTIAPVNYIAGVFAAQSVIAKPADGLQITITTTITSPTTLTQTYDVLNTGASAITDLAFADYFNFHPNSSQSPNHLLGTANMVAGSIFIVGSPLPSYISDGYMQGDRLPNAWTVGATPGDVIPDVENQAYDLAVGPIGPNDVAGALLFGGGALNPGQDVVFTIRKGLGPPPPVPEPSTLCASVCLLLFTTRARARR